MVYVFRGVRYTKIEVYTICSLCCGRNDVLFVFVIFVCNVKMERNGSGHHIYLDVATLTSLSDTSRLARK